MVVNIYNTSLRHRKARNPGYRVLKTGSGFLVEYRHPGVDDIMYISAGSRGQLNYITGRLDEKDPGFLRLLYLNRGRMANKKKQKRPGPEKIKAMARNGARALKQYLSGRGGSRVRDWGKYALSKKHVPLVTNNHDYGIGMGFGPAVEGGKVYYTTFMAPVPADGKTRVARGTVDVMDFLKIVAGFGPREYKATTGKLGKHSRPWAELLKQVRVKAKSNSDIRNGSLAGDLYSESLAA